MHIYLQLLYCLVGLITLSLCNVLCLCDSFLLKSTFLILILLFHLSFCFHSPGIIFFPLTYILCGFIYFKEIIINVQNEFNFKDIH